MEMREAKVVQRAVAIEPLLHHLSALPNHLLALTLISTAVIQCHLVAARRKHPCERSPKLHRRDANSVIWPSQSPLIHHPRRRVSLIQSLQTTHITTLTQPALHHGRRFSCSHRQQGLMGFFPQGITETFIAHLPRLSPLTRGYSR